jgi:predicted aconitase with swiveling domain
MDAIIGELLVSDQPFSFWGGYDYLTGEIIDRRNALSGQIAAGKVLAIPYTIGSSTTAQVLLEAIRAGTAPAAIITRRLDSYLVLAALVAEELYGRTIPVVTVSASEFTALKTGAMFTVTSLG